MKNKSFTVEDENTLLLHLPKLPVMHCQAWSMPSRNIRECQDPLLAEDQKAYPEEMQTDQSPSNPEPAAAIGSVLAQAMVPRHEMANEKVVNFQVFEIDKAALRLKVVQEETGAVQEAPIDDKEVHDLAA